MAQLDGDRAQRKIGKMVDRFLAEEEPPWLHEFHGPLDAGVGRTEVLRDFLVKDQKLSLYDWTKNYQCSPDHNIAIPTVAFDEKAIEAGLMGKPLICYSVLLGHPGDVARLARENPAKDPTQFPVRPHGIAVESDVTAWRRQRTHFSSAFLPSSLALAVDTIQDGVDSLLARWGELQLIDAHAELHHFALDMFLRTMFGTPAVLPPTPEESADVREAFNLDVLGVNDLMRTQGARGEFAESLLSADVAEPGPILQLIRGLDDPAERMFNIINFVVAGHDTTAHTLEWVLLELTRNQDVQQRCRDEADAVLRELEGREPRYEDLRRFPLCNAVITETLRLWGPALVVFRRKLSTDFQVHGKEQRLVSLPAGTRVNFWYFGHHHSEEFWGPTALEFRPFERDFSDAELQRGSHRTPASERFHPFSLPPRDCMGKNFSFLEMRCFLPRLLRRYHVGLDAAEMAKVEGLRCGAGELFFQLAALPGPVKPPKGLKFRLTPRSSVPTSKF